MTLYKPKTREVQYQEYEALFRKVLVAGTINEPRPPFTAFTMVDSDFAVTQNMAEARFIAWDNSMDYGLLQVDAAGDAILLMKSDE